MFLPFLWYYKYVTRRKYPSARDYMNLAIIGNNQGVERTYAIATFNVGSLGANTFVSSFHESPRNAWREIAQIIYNESK